MIAATNVTKSFGTKTVLLDFCIKVEKGDFISISGSSGVGKTTLINILGLLEKPTKGDIEVDGVVNPKKSLITLMQRNIFGYVFQNYGLIETDSVFKNLEIALAYQKLKNKKEAMLDALEQVGLQAILNKKVFELSGGEQQRVALARIILKKSNYVFADEPTGNLDKYNSELVFKTLKNFVDSGKAVIFVTHDSHLSKQAYRQVHMQHI